MGGNNELDFISFKDIMKRYQGRLFAVCYGILQNREDAKDALQEVLISAFKGIKNFRKESGIYVWLYRMAVNKSLDIVRKRVRMKRTLSKYEERRVEYEDDYLKLEIKDALRNAMESLPVKLKAAVVLREIENLSYKEIAKILNCSIGTVMSRIYNARKLMAKKLKEELKNQL